MDNFPYRRGALFQNTSAPENSPKEDNFSQIRGALLGSILRDFNEYKGVPEKAALRPQKPYILEEPDRFLPRTNYPFQEPSFMGFLNSLMTRALGASGTYNRLTGKIDADNINDIDLLSHEYQHYKNDQNREEKRRRAVDLMGGEEAHNNFIDALGQKTGYDQYYKYRKLVPFIGREKAEDELISYLVGGMAAGQVTKGQFENAVNNIHPNASKWFDIYTK